MISIFYVKIQGVLVQGRVSSEGVLTVAALGYGRTGYEHACYHRTVCDGL